MIEVIGKMENIKVSIIVPIYNVEKYLEECLESLVKQTLKEIELILVIDGSIDSSEAIARSYEHKYNNIKIIVQENQGLSGARNTGLRAAEGKYVYFVDSDDYISLDAMELLYDTAERKNADVVLFDADVFIDGIVEFDYTYMENVGYYDRPAEYSEVLSGQEMFCKMYENKHYRASACLLFTRKDLITDNGLEFFKGIIHEDELFTFQLLFYAEKVTHVNEKFFHRRLRECSIMTNSSARKHFEGCYWTIYILREKYALITMEVRMKTVYDQFINDNLVIAFNWYADLTSSDRKKFKKELKCLGQYAKGDPYANKLYMLLLCSPGLYKMVRSLKRYVCDRGKKEFYAG